MISRYFIFKKSGNKDNFPVRNEIDIGGVGFFRFRIDDICYYGSIDIINFPGPLACDEGGFIQYHKTIYARYFLSHHLISTLIIKWNQPFIVQDTQNIIK